MKNYSALGIMSGSSLDGVDLAYCTFQREKEKWSYQIVHADTIPFGEEWKVILSGLPLKSAVELIKYDMSFGIFLAGLANNFMDKYKVEPGLIASHGHTIFHEPDKGYTFQLGHGQTIALFTGLKTVNDFRIKDIQLGGQGAPLVPVGDELLFPEFDFCLNIGGIANISYHPEGERLALDVCPANQLLNHLSRQLGKAFDENGRLAQLGKLKPALFEQLNADTFFQLKPPKSLSNQYVQSSFTKILDNSNASLEDKLYTVVKHIAFQVNQVIKGFPKGKLLITGGGAHNQFLINAIAMETKMEIITPDNKLIDFKEALIFAFMGILRDLGEINCLASATGAASDSCGGVIYRP
ncbi:MAG: anhydro-N-acetylmuramic acid kinase [Bacteroidales bacterium]|nr:anhydro-N-acetylmuramic acid kinase [Bacteroidales bacterium]